jgi:hypothetical protein
MLHDFPQLRLDGLKPLDIRTDPESDLIGGESRDGSRHRMLVWPKFKKHD